jgi:hypothetical protein
MKHIFLIFSSAPVDLSDAAEEVMHSQTSICSPQDATIHAIVIKRDGFFVTKSIYECDVYIAREASTFGSLLAGSTALQ